MFALLLSRLIEFSGRVKRLLMADNRGDFNFMLAFLRIGLQDFLTGFDRGVIAFVVDFDVVVAGSLLRRRGFASIDKRARSGVRFFSPRLVDDESVVSWGMEDMVFGEGEALVLITVDGEGKLCLVEEGDKFVDDLVTGDGLRLGAGDELRLNIGEGPHFGPAEDGLLTGEVPDVFCCCCWELAKESTDVFLPIFALFAERNFEVRVCAGDKEALNEGDDLLLVLMLLLEEESVLDDRRPLDGRLIMGGVEGFS